MRSITRAFLGRDPNAAEYANYTQALAAPMSQMGGGDTVEHVKALVLGGQDYFTRSGGTNDGFLQALFRDVLHTQITGAELAQLRTQLQGGDPTTQAAFVARVSVAWDLLRSRRGFEAAVQDLFNRYLPGNFDAGKYNRFVDDLVNNRTSTEEVIRQMVISPAYNDYYA